MEHKLLQWMLGVAIFYVMFILIWRRLVRDPPAPKDKIRRRHNDDE